MFYIGEKHSRNTRIVQSFVKLAYTWLNTFDVHLLALQGVSNPIGHDITHYIFFV